MTSPHSRMKTEALQALSAIMSLQMQLCFLFLIYIFCKVDGNVKIQQKTALIKSVDKTVVIDCIFPSDCSSYIHWYQLKENQTLRRILYSSISDGATNNDAGFESFKVDKKQSNLALKIPELKEEHSAVYYCACWISGGTKVFGPGTRLYVTGKTESPKVSGYLPSKKYSDKDGNQTMLCHARDMIPDLVKFTWQKMSRTKEWEDVKENVVEQSYKVKENNQVKVKAVTSMMIIDKNTAENNDYQCIVTHEGVNEKPQILLMKKDEIKPTMVSKKQDCPPTDETIKNQISGDSEQIRSLYMFVYAYGVMIMKNVMYFCVVTIFLLKRKAARKKDESS
ncbi:immunoglobulin lambda-1 light chain-like isoform X1 [Carassius carassius]|uniref:immunoglobulin lambda-1 light chain-like isoform X1 n=1 Tax=Carassius carassius TaxID=217509 RepID=UPI0028692370|nr:immunoglobulin lambda-1 light chain-like isoform X1 [Carassius carassius]